MSLMPPSANDPHASARLQQYVDAFAARLRRRSWLRAAAVLVLLVFAVTLAGAVVAVHFGFGRGVLACARALLLVSIAAAATTLIVLPLRRLRSDQHRAIESATDAFDGRLRTYAELPQSAHPLRELLAEDALAVADRQPPQRRIARAQLLAPAIVALAGLMLLVWLGTAAPVLYRDGARAIWAGWLYRNWQPSLRIQVEPGDQAVRRGGEVTIRSIMGGFDPASAQLHAQMGSGVWQQVDMQRGARGFEFTLFSLAEPVRYYVSAAGVRSADYVLKVVDVPRIDQLQLVYHFPDWTRKPAQTQDDGGDISAIAGTHVDLTLHADRALGGGELVLDDAPTALVVNGQSGSAGIDVARDAHYYLAMRIGGERVRLTDDFLIKVLPDNKPDVRIVRPGRDYSASSIEEVAARVQASDDYGLEDLQLRYSVNGGSWKSVSLPVSALQADASHLFELEALRPEHEQRALAPGDLISYYAVARDHSQVSQTDMYFIDVQPFDRRFSQSQASGGGGGDGGEQDEISQRQREILVSTWNLLRQKQDPQANNAAAVHDNAALLSSLQKKLAAQAQSLAERTQSRELDSSDSKISTFVDSMKHASQLMTPAAQHLASTELEAAIAPEQQALQYLMRAEAQFTDMQVAMQRGGGGGGGNQADRDLSQIYELEMDLKKNQYESGQNATPEKQDRQGDDLARRLQELARRQQQLAQAAQKPGGLTAEQRWQQQSLQRDAEDLQRQLSQQQQQSQGQGGANGSSAQGSGSQPASAAGGGSSPGGESGGSSAASVAAASGSDSALARQLEQAIRDMQQAGAGNGADSDAAERARRAAQDAARSLNGAGTELARARVRALQQSIDAMTRRADQLYNQQRAAQAQLQSSVHADAAQRGQQGGLSAAAQAQLAEQERQLAAGVQQLGDQIGETGRRYRADAPNSAQALQDARQGLQDSDLKNRLDIAAQYIALGRGAYVAPSAAASTDALRALRDQLQRAAGSAAAAGGSVSAPRDPVIDELARVRALRSQLQALADASAAAQGSGSSAIAASGSGGAPDDSGDIASAAQAVGAGGGSLLPVLRARGVAPRAVDSIGALSRQVAAANMAGRADALAGALRRQISLLEQLDLQLSQQADANAIRAAISDPVADEYQTAVAEYYRQLSRQ